MEKVLVTGANGHLGYILTKMLSEKGYPVRAGVRDFKEEKIAHLKEISNVEVVKCDILNKSEFEKAVEGVNGLLHVAAVYKHGLKNPDESIIRPAVEGTTNALNMAKKYNIKIVLTSSCVAVGRAESKDKPLDENSWESSSEIPYHIGKTKAEQFAWKFSKENNINLTLINPVAIIGPIFYRNTPSTFPFTYTVNKKLTGIPPVDMNVVDVRDVALAHISAFENSNANGR